MVQKNRPLPTVEVNIYEGSKRIHTQRQVVTPELPNSRFSFPVNMTLKHPEYPHDDKITLQGLQVDIEAIVSKSR